MTNSEKIDALEIEVRDLRKLVSQLQQLVNTLMLDKMSLPTAPVSPSPYTPFPWPMPPQPAPFPWPMPPQPAPFPWVPSPFAVPNTNPSMMMVVGGYGQPASETIAAMRSSQEIRDYLARSDN